MDFLFRFCLSHLSYTYNAIMKSTNLSIPYKWHLWTVGVVLNFSYCNYQDLFSPLVTIVPSTLHREFSFVLHQGFSNWGTKIHPKKQLQTLIQLHWEYPWDKFDWFLVFKATASKETEFWPSKNNKRRKYYHYYLKCSMSWAGSGLLPQRGLTSSRSFFDRRLNGLQLHQKVVYTLGTVNDTETEASYHKA